MAALILLLGGSYYFLSVNKQQPVSEETPVVEETVIEVITPQELGLTFTARSDKKAVKFTITNIKDIQSVDYEISYIAKGDIPRGAIGHIEVKPKDKEIETNYIDLGTCSSGKCKYDEGVTSVKLILKIAKSDNKTYSSEKALDL